MYTFRRSFRTFSALALWLASGLYGLAAAQDLGSRHAPTNAHAAQKAVTRGAVVLDVRAAIDFAQGSLPGAVSLPGLADQGATERLARMSQTGVDLSREVLLLGDAGSESVQALHAELARVSSGQVLWLVGGLAEWQAIGAPVQRKAFATVRLPVPQHWARLPGLDNAFAARGAGQMAAPQRREAQEDTGKLYGFARLY